ncbi:DDB1- and CUL4-associated factor 1 [Ditylenchus destructor]|nr:DDB1- and CUL4-associated factor 1 [Ditylenchus destructor]
MAEEMSMADDEVIEELSTLLEVWENEKDTASFDPDPLLLSVTEILEKSYNDYLMHNPDPMDKTHPMYLLPNCNFGHLLNIIFRNEEFINKLIISYVLTRDNLNRNIVAARLLLVLFSSNASEILSDEDSNSLLEELFRWAETSESRELRAYSFGLLGVAEGLPERRQHNQRLLPIALERLRTLFQEMLANNANPEDERKRVTINDPANGPTDFRTAFTLENSKDANQKKSAPASSSHPANGGGDNRIRMNGVTLGRNPWDSGDFDSTDVCKIVDSKEKMMVTGSVNESKRPKFGNQPVCLNQINGDVQRSSAQLKPSPNNYVAPTHENGPLGLGEDFFAASGGFSNSSWKNTMHPIVIGTAYKLHPLPVEMEQRLILQYVIHACSAGDTLSLLLEHRVLDLIGLYLGKDSCKDIRLLYDVLNLTSSLLEYRKFGWDFIAAQGVQKLLQVNQYSLAGTLVANCLGILSRDVDIFSHVCQLPDSILNDLVDYALWLLDHSYESAREIIGIFFAHSLQFRAILERFDQRDGLRRLYNYIAGLAILHKTTEEIEDDPQADMLWSQSYLTIRSGVSAFRTYLSSHVFLRIEHMKRSQATRHIVGQIGMYPIPSAIPNGGHSHTKAMCLDAVSERECITYLIQTQCLLMSHHHNWRPIDDMRKLGVFRLLLVLLSKSRKPDSVRLVLEVLHLATVSPKVQLDMCETVQVKNAPTQGIGSVLEFAEGEWLDDPQIQKLALEVFINCVGAPAERGAGRGLHYKISCLSPGLLPAHLASLPSTSQGASTSSYVQNMERRVFLDPSDILYVAWTCAQQNNAIMVLTTLLHIKEPPTDADLLREVACRALNGIVRHEPVRQILSKLPLISANELNSLMQEPVLLEKRQEHSRFCEQARLLIESVTQTKIVHEYPKDMTQEKLWKASVVAQTRIVYNEKELLQLMFQHLVDIGFKKTASQLQQEANLPNIPASRIPPTPTSLPRFPRQNELSFARTKGVDTPVRPSPLVGKGAMATPTTLLRRQLSNGSPSISAAAITNHLSTSSPQLPTESPKPAQMGTISTRPASSISTSLPNGISPKRLPLKFERPPSFATSSACGQFVAPQSAGTSNVPSGQFSLQVKPYKSLGEIVTEYFRKQHTACRNPVATCPPFSLF